MIKLDRTLTYRLHLLHKLTDQESQRAYVAEAGLSMSDGRCLTAVGTFAPLSVNDLAQKANLNKGQASRAADSLRISTGCPPASAATPRSSSRHPWTMCRSRHRRPAPARIPHRRPGCTGGSPRPPGSSAPSSTTRGSDRPAGTARSGAAARLSPLAADHRAHAAELTKLISTGSSAAASAVAADTDLRAAEQTAQRNAVAACKVAPGDRVALVGSIAACRATHVEALR